ncbi:MAG: pyruvate:ferredoxin (flavodoxin) oxidoreductase, partial [Planctomycetes bacterium]|nr:pyruvate:ferredoxin (flavodoxin) oxidoreductase [Planctomycetota bacterium]
DPNRPVLRGSAQNPDVFFQAREAVNSYYDAVPGIVQDAMDALRDRCGRAYSLFDYVGDPDAERVVLMMGSGCGAAEETVQHLMAAGEKVGLLKVRLYRPWSTGALLRALPESARRIAVLDRTKEPGSGGEPLYLDVVAALAEGARPAQVIGGRFGLSSKEFTPGMVKAVFDELKSDEPRRHFTIGIRDDVTNLSLPWKEITTTAPGVKQAVFFGLGSDGTVGANKNSIKIIGEHTPLFAQGYFVYDSKKSGSTTVSHLRFGPQPINSTYLVSNADFVACHQFSLMDNLDVFAPAREGATFLLNSPFPPDEVWDRLSREAQDSIIAKRLRFFVVDGHSVANEVGLKNRINTVMQTCFFALADILPRDEAIERIKGTIRKTWGNRGESIVRKNIAAVDLALDALHEVKIPNSAGATRTRSAPVPETAPDFVQRVTAMIIAGKGDLLPVSAMPIDGTFPTSTSRFERRSIANEIPVWDPEICIECALCALVCPHAAIRMKVLSSEDLASAPEGFATRAWNGREYENGGSLMTIQVAPDDCTGCNVCAEVCPAQSKEVAKHKALDMRPKHDHLERQRRDWDHFLTIPEPDRTKVNVASIKGSQMLEPLFEFSGACAGCGETPYLKLLTQLFGDRLVVANATGCSSIYGGNLPTTPWTTNENGQGPAWANSLFEDNAEFGLGMRLAVDQQRQFATVALRQMAGELGADLVKAVIDAPQDNEEQVNQQRERVCQIREHLKQVTTAEARLLESTIDALVDRSVWIIGGDGWAYDIG